MTRRNLILILAVVVTVVPALVHYLMGVRKSRRLAKAGAAASSDDTSKNAEAADAPKPAENRRAGEPEVFGGSQRNSGNPSGAE